jgi:hypothetical protein
MIDNSHDSEDEQQKQATCTVVMGEDLSPVTLQINGKDVPIQFSVKEAGQLDEQAAAVIACLKTELKQARRLNAALTDDKVRLVSRLRGFGEIGVGDLVQNRITKKGPFVVREVGDGKASIVLGDLNDDSWTLHVNDNYELHALEPYRRLSLTRAGRKATRAASFVGGSPFFQVAGGVLACLLLLVGLAQFVVWLDWTDQSPGKTTSAPSWEDLDHQRTIEKARLKADTKIRLAEIQRGGSGLAGAQQLQRENVKRVAHLEEAVEDLERQTKNLEGGLKRTYEERQKIRTQVYDTSGDLIEWKNAYGKTLHRLTERTDALQKIMLEHEQKLKRRKVQ